MKNEEFWSVANVTLKEQGFSKKLFRSVLDIAKAKIRTKLHSRDLSVVRLQPGLRLSKHVAIILVYNEARRIPFLLRYYRKMGFEHFIVVDNKSDDGLQTMISGESDVSLFFSRGIFKNARFGMDWINYILSKYCAGKWILHIDADEFLVFPHSDTLGISHLTSNLEKKQRPSLQCLMLDMYSEHKIKDNVCAVGDDPASVCQFFDETGYVTHYDPIIETFWIKGGVRGRIYFPADLSRGPALNKTPLVLWQSHYAFLKCAHELWPASVNGGPPAAHVPHGVLLHFKFLSDLTEKLLVEAVRKQHTSEYDAYSKDGILPDDGPDFMCSHSRQYSGWRSLKDAGLLDGEDGLVSEIFDQAVDVSSTKAMIP